MMEVQPGNSTFFNISIVQPMKKILTVLAFVAIAMTINAQTSDQKILAVRGPVKRIVYTEGQDPILNVEMVSFNRNSMITQLVPYYHDTPNDKGKIKRNSYNFLKGWQIYWGNNSLNDRMQNNEYFYGSDGYINKVSCELLDAGYDAEITWDETGNIRYFVAKGGAELVEYSFINTYVYLEFDRYGNWIEAECTTSSTEIYEDDYDNIQRSTFTSRISRRIEYYE